MSYLRGVFLHTNNISRSGYVWNMVSSLLFACQSALMLIIITRTNGIDDAGVFSISYSVACMMAFIGEYGMRRFQASDVTETYDFSDYFTSRILTCLIMSAACLAYGLYGILALGYSGRKFTILMLVCMVKLVEAVHDVFYGRFQQVHRLDVSAKTSSFRIIFGMLMFGVALIATGDLLVSCGVWVVSVAIGTLFSAVLVAPDFCTIAVRFRPEKIRGLLLDCFPLFLGTFLLQYIGNAPKYAIDAHMSDAMQACYNFIFMPVFVIGLFANFVFNPILVELAESWEERNLRKFNRMILRQSLVIGAITLLAVAVALTIGCPVLGAMYNTDLRPYRADLAILMIGGGMLAMVNFITVVTTVIRAQQYLSAGYILVSLAALLFSGRIVMLEGIRGATILYTGLMTLMTIIFVIILVWNIKKRK